jgi:hypothetical protein
MSNNSGDNPGAGAGAASPLSPAASHGPLLASSSSNVTLFLTVCLSGCLSFSRQTSAHLLALCVLPPGRCCGWTRRRCCWWLTQQQIRARSGRNWVSRGRSSAPNRQVSVCRLNCCWLVHPIVCAFDRVSRVASFLCSLTLTSSSMSGGSPSHTLTSGAPASGFNGGRQVSLFPFDQSGFRSVTVLEATSGLLRCSLSTGLIPPASHSRRDAHAVPAHAARCDLARFAHALRVPDARRTQQPARRTRPQGILRGTVSLSLSFVAGPVSFPVDSAAFAALHCTAALACTFPRRSLLLLRFPRSWTPELEAAFSFAWACLSVRAHR